MPAVDWAPLRKMTSLRSLTIWGGNSTSTDLFLGPAASRDQLSANLQAHLDMNPPNVGLHLRVHHYLRTDSMVLCAGVPDQLSLLRSKGFSLKNRPEHERRHELRALYDHCRFVTYDKSIFL